MTLIQCRRYYAAGLAANLQFVGLVGVAVASVSVSVAKASLQVQGGLLICSAGDRADCDMNGMVQATEIEEWERRHRL
jgi:hypothetical protein